MKTYKTIVFPSIAATLGGAQSVQVRGKYAHIKLASGETAKIALIKLPVMESWTAFNLADSVPPK